jgi:hypothetical protein
MLSDLVLETETERQGMPCMKLETNFGSARAKVFFNNKRMDGPALTCAPLSAAATTTTTASLFSRLFKVESS